MHNISSSSSSPSSPSSSSSSSSNILYEMPIWWYTTRFPEHSHLIQRPCGLPGAQANGEGSAPVAWSMVRWTVHGCQWLKSVYDIDAFICRHTYLLSQNEIHHNPETPLSPSNVPNILGYLHNWLDCRFVNAFAAVENLPCSLCRPTRQSVSANSSSSSGSLESNHFYRVSEHRPPFIIASALDFSSCAV